MKIKPEDLRLANKVAGIKDSTVSDVRKNYWNGVHRLVTNGTNLVLKTTDHTFWLEWYIPIEGEPTPMDVIVQERPFDYAARYLEGGSLEVTRQNRIITLAKGQLHYRLREETPQTYLEPEVSETVAVWKMESKLLAKALKFIAPFIDEKIASVHKSVATLYQSGDLIAGTPKRIALVKGLKTSADWSVKSRSAKALAEFLGNIGEWVEITVMKDKYKFRDPDHHHVMVIPAEAGRFPKVHEQKSTKRDNLPKEAIQIDRKTLLQRTVAFGGTMPAGVERINLTFKGEQERASLYLYTPGENKAEITDDEFAVYRNFLDIEGETPQELATRKSQTDFGLSREHLGQALEVMEGTTIKMTYSGRMVIIEDEVGSEGEGGTKPNALERVVIITVGQTKRDTEPERKEEKTKEEIPVIEKNETTTVPIAEGSETSEEEESMVEAEVDV